MYLFFNFISGTYFFTEATNPKDTRKRTEIGNGDVQNLYNSLDRIIDPKRHAILYVGESVPEEVRKGLKNHFRNSKFEIETRKGI